MINVDFGNVSTFYFKNTECFSTIMNVGDLLTNCFCCYKTSDCIFYFLFDLNMSQREPKRIQLEHQKQSDLKNVTFKVNDKTRTGFKSTFFFLLCVTKLFEFEFEMFSKKNISRCYKKNLNRNYFP